ncbi:4-hydroxy-tetrahydrodipicolinate reductase [Leucobacter coleopterorum]|uniref:4-hydroxy-tetrahydrodipicolinate reductase n=1 Tax=Leucobacter coleopterorum TaxID=2714933 RepID=A0ABX6JWY6_9MICO|nr:4-hydroxy-tetrahydrodipicolinate reductase [Leucobacter coleopterorum]QIM18822.1 4-hydroxy-tetrahydrodipicolinate reductase [Leucobacter coleopterorum]
MTVKVAVAGATGRLGRLVCEIVEADPAYELVAKLSSRSDAEEGAEAQILVDVSHPDASPAIVERALSRGQRVLVGTSGWSEAKLGPLRERIAGLDAAVIVVPNFSLGSVLGTVLSQIAAPLYDSIEIIEAHHPAKVDSPSGTAVRTAELMAAARDGKPVAAPFAEQPARGELVAGIPVHSLRLSGVVAKQEVRLGGPGEVLSISHDTHSDEAYRAGIVAALAALQAASGLTVGLESVLGLDGILANQRGL